MGRVFASCNQKGGVGKTTTAINTASYLASAGIPTLLIDLDPQGNATSGLGIDRGTLRTSIYEVIMGEVPLSNIIQRNRLQNLDVAPANSHLAGAEVELVTLDQRATKLKAALTTVRDNYRAIIIDCPPSLSLLTVNALVAADEVIIPIQCEYFALEGLGHLVKTIELVRRSLNPELKIFGILLTMYDSRTLLAQQVVNETRKHFGSKVFETVIPRNIRLAEAPSFGQPILLYDPSSAGARAYQKLVEEMIEHIVPAAAPVSAVAVEAGR